MAGEEELAFLSAHLGELFPTVLWQLQLAILGKNKRTEAEAATKAKG